MLREVPFERASRGPFAQATILYDGRDGLAAVAGREDVFEATRGEYLPPGTLQNVQAWTAFE